ncbi:MAG: DUF899 domain-containing protein [Gaiellaceae bacterium]
MPDNTSVLDHTVVSEAEWVKARKAHMKREKELTRLRDELSAERRGLPWLELDKDYVFSDASGTFTLAELFQGRSQLIVYHFMYGPDWEEGCPSCSFWADNFDGIPVHLAHRDATFVAVSRASVEQLEAYAARLGWSFPWYSSADCDFNFDMGVSFVPVEGEEPGPNYNFGTKSFGGDEAPGVSVFYRDNDRVFLTYQTFARGLDILNGAYHYLDLTPKGRDEDELPWTMAWLSRNDAYTE